MKDVFMQGRQIESYLLLHHSARVKLGRVAGKETQLRHKNTRPFNVVISAGLFTGTNRAYVPCVIIF